jgi:hypothetical protein
MDMVELARDTAGSPTRSLEPTRPSRPHDSSKPSPMPAARRDHAATGRAAAECLYRRADGGDD